LGTFGNIGTYGDQTKIQKRRFGKFNLEKDVNYEALKVICNKNIKRPRKYGDIGAFGNMSTGRILAKNCKMA
jgi:hypothetical protein